MGKKMFNDHTGDPIKTKAANRAYINNYDKIDFSKNKDPEPVESSETQLSNFTFDPLMHSVVHLFSISAADYEKIDNWLHTEVYPPILEKQKDVPGYKNFIQKDSKGRDVPYSGAIGGGLTFQFTPSSLGVITKVIYADSAQLDLTDYDSF